VTSVRELFEGIAPGTIGLEEEVLLLDPETLAPKPCVDAVLERAPDNPRLKRELPAAQIELRTEPHPSVAEALAELAQARAELVTATAGLALPAAAALHPTAPAHTELNTDERYDLTRQRHGIVAERQLVGALQIHVAVGPRTLEVYNALRNYLPELAALAAAAPFHENRDTGLASMRPIVGGQLPRQGVPPAFASWADLEAELAWGRTSQTVEDPRRWWWELRPHLEYGTLELRVPDVQPTLRHARGVATFAVALVRHLTDHPEPPALTWRIEENRWAALHLGVDGSLADLESGERRATRDRLHTLADMVEPYAEAPLDATRALIERNAAMELRAAGLEDATRWLTDRFAG
jgi:carboxylate-amine ligase